MAQTRPSRHLHNLPKRFSVCGLVKRVGYLSVLGHGSLRGRIAPHDGFRWRIVSNVVCGLRGSCRVPTVFTRSINLRPFGTPFPALPARIQFRQWPPVSIDSPFLISRASASTRQFCARWRQRLCGTRAVQPVERPKISTPRNALPV